MPREMLMRRKKKPVWGRVRRRKWKLIARTSDSKTALELEWYLRWRMRAGGLEGLTQWCEFWVWKVAEWTEVMSSTHYKLQSMQLLWTRLSISYPKRNVDDRMKMGSDEVCDSESTWHHKFIFVPLLERVKKSRSTARVSAGVDWCNSQSNSFRLGKAVRETWKVCPRKENLQVWQRRDFIDFSFVPRRVFP